MAIRFSTGLRDKMFGKGRATIHAALAAATISFDNASAEIRDSGNGFITAGFLPGDQVFAFGTINNSADFKVLSVAEGVLVVSPAPTNEALGTVFVLVAGTGGQLRDVMRNGVLKVYSGSQPATADTAASGTLLAEFTVNGGAFTAGTAANGINFDESDGAVISKAAAESWKATAVATGTAGWARFCANGADNGLASTTLPRIDMSVGTTTAADMRLATTAIVAASVYYINDGSFTFPYQYGA